MMLNFSAEKFQFNLVYLVNRHRNSFLLVSHNSTMTSAPLAVAIVTTLGDSQRLGVSVILVFLIIGYLIMSRVEGEQG